ncbi:unnamed protein product [Closterium sp. Naga37s-1]|nr:unnamed protein product [Closterium sp. Naga37s-1]
MPWSLHPPTPPNPSPCLPNSLTSLQVWDNYIIATAIHRHYNGSSTAMLHHIAHQLASDWRPLIPAWASCPGDNRSYPGGAAAADAASTVVLASADASAPPSRATCHPGSHPILPHAFLPSAWGFIALLPGVPRGKPVLEQDSSNPSVEETAAVPVAKKIARYTQSTLTWGKKVGNAGATPTSPADQRSTPATAGTQLSPSTPRPSKSWQRGSLKDARLEDLITMSLLEYAPNYDEVVQIWRSYKKRHPLGNVAAPSAREGEGSGGKGKEAVEEELEAPRAKGSDDDDDNDKQASSDDDY